MVRDGRLARGSHGIPALFEEGVVTYFDALTCEALDGGETAAAAKVYSMATDEKPVYNDSVTGQPLDSALVEQARALEME